MADIDPEAMDYVELHGTGTPKGDPVEAEALGVVMAARPADRPCRVGSIKTNIGHLDAAAGVLGLIKTALCIRHRELVPSLHFERVNPAIDLDRLELRVQTTVEPWPRPGVPAIAGVTSIGFGGTNVHAILREVDASAKSALPDEPSYVLALSAKSDGALASLAERFAGWLEGGGSPCPALGDVAYTLTARRSHHDLRLAVTGASPKSISARLRGFLAETATPSPQAHGGARSRRASSSFSQGTVRSGSVWHAISSTATPRSLARSRLATRSFTGRRGGP